MTSRMGSADTMASPRSPRKWVSDGFIARHPLPERPHKNLRLHEALQLAKDWGCQIRHRNDNDVIVSHPLISEGRYAIPVSMGRRDTSQALVSLLRRVADATEKHPKYLDSVPPVFKPAKVIVPPVIIQPPTPKEPEPVSTLAIPAPAAAVDNGHHPVPGPRLVGLDTPPRLERPERPAAEKRPPTGQAELAGKISRYFGSMAAALHYRHHCTDTLIVPFGDCDQTQCKEAHDHLERIRSLGERSEQIMGMYYEARSEGERLLDQLTKPVKSETAPGGLGTKVGAPLIPSVQPRPFSNVLVKPMLSPGDDENDRRFKLLTMLENLKDQCRPYYQESSKTFRNMTEAIELVMERNNWNPSFERCMVEGSFKQWYGNILKVKRPGGVRNMVGKGAIAELEAALATIKLKVKHG